MAADRRTQRLLMELRQPTFEDMDPHRLLNWYFGYAFEPHEDDLHVVIEISPAYGVSEDKMDDQEGQSYREIAEVLKDTKEVRALEDAVLPVTSSNRRGPVGSFIVLENSSGMGKTQMAFKLMACGSVEVFYVVCGLSGELASKKPLCFMVYSRSAAIRRCIERDLEVIDEGTVSDISDAHGCIRRRSYEEVVEAIDRPCVFFLDEFPVLGIQKEGGIAKTNEICFIRNVFHSVGLIAILSSTHAAARNLIKSSHHSRTQSGAVWCTVLPTVPAFLHPGIALAPPILQSMIKSSRPLFAKEVLDFASENPFTDGSLIGYMDMMAAALSRKFDVWKSAVSAWYRTGQVCLFLGASYADQENVLIHGHYAQPAESEPFVLCLTEDGEVTKNGESEPWVCRSVFPPIETDVLLYPCLMGGKDFSALMDDSTNPIPFCEALAAVETMDRTMLHFKNPDWTTNDGKRLEALVSGSIVLASHSNGFGGMAFQAFFQAFLYELGVYDSPSVGTPLPDYVASIQVPFLGPPNTTWPLWLPSEWKLGSLRVTDMGCLSCTSAKIPMEWRAGVVDWQTDYLSRTLLRIPRSTMVHVAVARTSPTSEEFESSGGRAYVFIGSLLANMDWRKSRVQVMTPASIVRSTNMAKSSFSLRLSHKQCFD